MSANPESVVREFFSIMGRKASLLKAIEACCAEACRWENTGLPTAPDRKGMLAMMQGFIDGYQLDHMRVDFVVVAVNGDTVLTERIDHLNRADGSTVASLALAGALQVKDGKIVRWTDYFDPRPFLPT